MDRKAAKRLIDVGNENAVLGVTKDNIVLRFTRQTMEDVEEIEKMDDESLINEWKSLVWMNYIYGQVSVNELQRISLIEYEMSERDSIDMDALMEWYDKQEERCGGEC